MGLQSAGILIEIKFPSLCSSLGGRNKNTGCLERRSSSSFSTVNKTLWSQPFKIGFTWINKSLTGASCNTVNEIAQEGRRLWVIDRDSNTRHCKHYWQVIVWELLINTTCSALCFLFARQWSRIGVHDLGSDSKYECHCFVWSDEKQWEFILNATLLMSSFILTTPRISQSLPLSSAEWINNEILFFFFSLSGGVDVLHNPVLHIHQCEI